VNEGEIDEEEPEVRKMRYAGNLIRFVNAPVMSAGVMMANII
jgi:hypothetical protein